MLPINEIMGSVCQHWIQEIQTDSLRLWSIFILLQASVMAVREPFLEISKTAGHAIMPYIAMLMYIGSLSRGASYLHLLASTFFTDRNPSSTNSGSRKVCLGHQTRKGLPGLLSDHTVNPLTTDDSWIFCSTSDSLGLQSQMHSMWQNLSLKATNQAYVT